MLKISDISEFNLIKRLEAVILAHANPNPTTLDRTSIGDDAAVISPVDDIQVVTTDTMVENVHFRRDAPHKESCPDEEKTFKNQTGKNQTFETIS